VPSKELLNGENLFASWSIAALRASSRRRIIDADSVGQLLLATESLVCPRPRLLNESRWRLTLLAPPSLNKAAKIKRAQLYSVEPTAFLAPTIISSISILLEFLTRSPERRQASVSMRKKRRTGIRGALAGFRLSPEEKALIASVLDDYGQQERWADALSASRDELIAVLEKILERYGAE
jgi:hypothetical protein